MGVGGRVRGRQGPGLGLGVMVTRGVLEGVSAPLATRALPAFLGCRRWCTVGRADCTAPPTSPRTLRVRRTVAVLVLVRVVLLMPVVRLGTVHGLPHGLKCPPVHRLVLPTPRMVGHVGLTQPYMPDSTKGALTAARLEAVRGNPDPGDICRCPTPGPVSAVSNLLPRLSHPSHPPPPS